MFGLFKNLFGQKVDYKELAAKGAIIVDVRTPGEYQSGHIKGSVNIPLDKIGTQAESLKKKGKPVITCCLSGGRSGSAASILRSKGIDAYNGGPWSTLRGKLK